MATVTLNRSDLFPVGTTVGVYPRNSVAPDAGATGSAIASAAVAADGTLTVTNAGIADYTPYTCYAKVAGEHRYALVQSNLTAHVAGPVWRQKVKDRRTAIGTTLPGAP